ncbi:MAG: pyrroline-5-carboxylate reductase [Fusobacteria bacterium]|nr:pyrroline-5-carboxylate reductase [Fusobacteriota bacterium]
MKLGFIGAGKMAEAYISALEKDNEIVYIEKNIERDEYIKSKYRVESQKNLSYLIKDSDFIILAVKPQNIEEVLTEISKLDIKMEELSNKIFISIAAGIKIKTIEKYLNKNNIKIVRVMPNTPAAIKKGISAYTLNDNIKSSEEIFDIETILKATGEIVYVNEKDLDIVTAISGSGPAYVFVMLNAIADAGVKNGLTKDLALKFAVETFIGASYLVKQSGEHPEKLKDSVTSPSGTTAAGLAMLEKNNIRTVLIETIDAAYNKSIELGKGE